MFVDLLSLFVSLSLPVSWEKERKKERNRKRDCVLTKINKGSESVITLQKSFLQKKIE